MQVFSALHGLRYKGALGAFTIYDYLIFFSVSTIPHETSVTYGP